MGKRDLKPIGNSPHNTKPLTLQKVLKTYIDYLMLYKQITYEIKAEVPRRNQEIFRAGGVSWS